MLLYLKAGNAIIMAFFCAVTVCRNAVNMTETAVPWNLFIYLFFTLPRIVNGDIKVNCKI